MNAVYNFAMGSAEAVLAALTQEARAELAQQIATSAAAQWRLLAAETLPPNEVTVYQAGIQEAVLEGDMAVVMLVGDRPNQIENGSPPYDMHDTLLGPKVPVVDRGSGQKGKHKRKGGGFYRAIPFRQQTPGTTGVHKAQMGAAYAQTLGQQAAAELGKKAYAHAKNLTPSLRTPGQPTRWGGRLPPGLAPKLKAHHHSDLLAGMVKLQETYKKATQNYYMTFRTIATGSPGWRHKGTEGAHLLAQVAQFADAEGPKVVKNFLQGLFPAEAPT